MEIETKAVHAGYSPDPTTNAVAVPIYQTTAYAFDDAQHGADLFNLAVLGNIYTRIMNPTNDVLEQRIAAMEGGVAALALASGQAATTYAIQTIAEAGDNVISMSTLYGGTYNLFAHTFPQMGIEVRFADPENLDAMAALIDDKTKAVYCESLGNPAGNIVDIAKICEIAHAHGVAVIVDNTVPSPYLCRPIEHGADIVVHSLTKYIGGHGTIIGGMIVDSNNFDWVANKDRYQAPQRTRRVLPRRGLHRDRLAALHPAGTRRTVAQHGRGAGADERLPRLAGPRNPAAAHGSYLREYADHRQAPRRPRPGRVGALRRARQQPAQGSGRPVLRRPPASGILSFGIKGGLEGGTKFLDALQLITRLVNIGDAKSLATHPASTTHRQLSDEELAASGVSPELVRLSIGIENVNDIIADIDQALAAAG